MPKRVEDVLRSRRTNKEVSCLILSYRNELNTIRQLLNVLENACTAYDCPQQFYTNAVLADLIDDRVNNVELGLSKIQKLLRQIS